MHMHALDYLRVDMASLPAMEAPGRINLDTPSWTWSTSPRLTSPLGIPIKKPPGSALWKALEYFLFRPGKCGSGSVRKRV